MIWPADPSTVADGSSDPPVALVTGAARGIGAAVATCLAAAGWRLVLVDVCKDDPDVGYRLASPEQLQLMVAACGGPDSALGVVADVRDQHALATAAAAAVDRFGGLRAVVAAAGAIAGGTPAWKTDDDTFSTMVGINLEGVWRTARATVPVLLQQPEPRTGRFVAVASAGGMVGLPLLGAYAAAKHGVIGLVRSLAAELGTSGVTVNAVAPGSTDTDMLQASADVYDLTDPSELAVHQLQQRIIEPREVASFICWLCGPESSAITGAVLPVDGGMTAH